MGVTKLTALTIQSWPNVDTIGGGGGIYVTAGGSDKAGWSGHVYLVKNGEVHQQLLSTEPVFKSKDKAVADMKRVVEQIRDLLLESS